MRDKGQGGIVSVLSVGNYETIKLNEVLFVITILKQF